MLIEVHMLKNYPPVNLNRDDSGAPKTCFFGGVQRGRISSQCLKRSWRISDNFRKMESFGIRTRHMPERVGNRLEELGVDQDFINLAIKKLTGIANKNGNENSKGNYTAQIVIYSEEEIERIAQSVKAAIEEDGDIKTFEKRSAKNFDKLLSCAKDKPISADIALFGRMVTSDYFADVDAAMQVAHAISTHAVNRESDYFTAVDDLIDNDNDDSDSNAKGGGMIGDVDYNSCCYYEYASIDTDILRNNLKSFEDRDSFIEKLVPTIIKTMAYTNPSGKQNTFAGQVLPDMVMVECKKDKVPLSYVNAFEEPVSVWGNQPNLVENSLEKFIKHVDCMDEAYNLPVIHRVFFAPRFPSKSPTKCDVYKQFDTIASVSEIWLKEDDLK